MKEQGISNQAQFTTQQKRVELERKMFKDIPNRVIYMVASAFKNKYKEFKKMLPVIHFQPNLHFF